MTVPKVEVVVLGLLAEGPCYGYELLERARDRSLPFWAEVGKASVYQALRRLEAQRRIAGRAQEGTDGPDRRVYRLTPAGRQRLREGLFERFGDDGPYEVVADLAMGFAHLLSAPETRRGLEQRVSALEGRRAAIAEERSRVVDAQGPGRAMALRLLDQQDALAETELAWLAVVGRDLGRLRG
jgi:DNA-binding PadR family transcriptional regulator